VHHCDSLRIKDQLDTTCYFISLLMCSTCFGHNISIISSLRLFCWIITLVVLFLVRCVLVWLSWNGIRVAGFTPTKPHRNSNTRRTKNNTTNVVIQQNIRKLLMMDILMSETRWAYKKWNKIASDIKLVFILQLPMLMLRMIQLNNQNKHQYLLNFIERNF